MKTTIKQTQDFFNPYFFEGKQVQNIYFFDATGVKASCRWFQANGSNNDYPEFDLPTEEIKRKNKVTFDKEVFFYAKNNEPHFEGINLYIPLNKIKHKFLGEELNYTSKMDDNFYSVLQIELNAVKRTLELNKDQKAVSVLTDKKPQTIKIKYGYRTVKKPYGLKLEEKAEQFKKALGSNNISKYDIERLVDAKLITL